LNISEKQTLFMRNARKYTLYVKNKRYWLITEYLRQIRQLRNK